jgi:hypothetical protein
MIRIVLSVIFVGSLIVAPLCEAKVLFPFEGRADINSKELNLTVFPGGPSPLVLSITPASQNQYQIKIKTDHLVTPFFEISTELTGMLEVVADNKSSPALIGKVSSQYSLINFKPAQETTGGFEIRDGVLTINTLSIGNIQCEGTLGLAAPYPVNMTVHFDEVHLKEFISFFAGKKEFAAEGQVAGDINISGSVKELQLKGALASYRGTVKGFDFDHMLLNLAGTYPVIQVIESDIAQAGGFSFQVKGFVDLSDKENFDKQIQALAREPFVADDRTNREWTIKRMRSDSQNSKTELKYQLRKDEAQPASQEEDAMIGVTRTVEF